MFAEPDVPAPERMRLKNEDMTGGLESLGVRCQREARVVFDRSCQPHGEGISTQVSILTHSIIGGGEEMSMRSMRLQRRVPSKNKTVRKYGVVQR